MFDPGGGLPQKLYSKQQQPPGWSEERLLLGFGATVNANRALDAQDAYMGPLREAVAQPVRDRHTVQSGSILYGGPRVRHAPRLKRL